ncbi:DUF3054 domain-containing protein [Nocardioides campestrisoli]|uniref:DUF3054 domain-containing protein n=1 Tax=Nocardioides campestrisoli TaxID=2736757 RepID=UPI0015E65F31|nr:DUF3054 domain-containing protein [Nocardioides campestrisoli]
MPALPILLDFVAVLIFAALGRRSHEGDDGLLAVVDIAWPFLVGALVGHLLLRAVPALRRLSPARLPAGLVVWPSTVVLGMVLRQLTGDGTAWSFVAVATGVLGVAMLAWRQIATLVDRPGR